MVLGENRNRARLFYYHFSYIHFLRPSWSIKELNPNFSSAKPSPPLSLSEWCREAGDYKGGHWPQWFANGGKLILWVVRVRVRLHWNGIRENQPPWSVQFTIDPRLAQKNLSFMTEVWRLNVEQLRVFTIYIGNISQYLSILYSANDNMECMTYLLWRVHKLVSQSSVFDDYPSSRTIGVSYITLEIPVMDLKYF